MSQYLEGAIIQAATDFGIHVDELYGQWNVACMTVEANGSLLVAVEFFLEAHKRGGAS